MELKSVTASVYFSSDVANPDTYSHFYTDIQMYTTTMTQPDPELFMLQFTSWEVATKDNKWQGRNITRWKNEEYDKLFRAAEGEMDPVKRAALFIKMNDLVIQNAVVVPVVARPAGGRREQSAARRAERLGLATSGRCRTGTTRGRRHGRGPGPSPARRPSPHVQVPHPAPADHRSRSSPGSASSCSSSWRWRRAIPFEELATNPNVPPEVRANLRTQFGLDDPIPIRYARWFSSMLRGDWGFSFVSRIDVVALILQRLPTTLFVLGSAQLLGLLVALPIGVYSAMRPYSFFDQVTTTLAFVGFSLPTFFTGLLFILFFSIYLDWLPFIYRADVPGTGLAWMWAHGQAGHHAGGRARPLPGRLHDALRALGRARGDPARLHQYRAGQGPLREGHHHQARGAERADPGGDAHRAPDPRHLHRRGDHRADLPGARHRRRCSSARSSPTTRP